MNKQINLFREDLLVTDRDLPIEKIDLYTSFKNTAVTIE